jgi:flagellar hook-length control protein FliK
MGVPQQVGGKAWEGAIADRVMWMVQGEQQFAKLRLNPPNLGPLEVRVSVNQDQANVSFVAQHAAVREALEAAMPRLREMFDQQSMQLVRADVSDPGTQHGDRAHQSTQHANAKPGPSGDETHDEDADAQASSAAISANNLIDLFV